MAIYNIKDVEIVWRGITLRGFSSTKVSVTEDAKAGAGSNTIVMGIAGECFVHPNTSRTWTITSNFNSLSVMYPILLQDNLNNVEDTLIIRDLNNGISDFYTHCSISQITNADDGVSMTVKWTAVKRNWR